MDQTPGTFLNLLCHRSNLLPSVNAWSAFALSWLQSFGAPEVLISDGGAEFASVFACELENKWE